MKTLNFKTLLTATVATVSTVVVAAQSAQAFSFTKLDTDWHIVQDSFKDGTDSVLGANSNFEMFGMAAKIENGQAYFVFNGNLGRDKHDGVGQGDLFFNFTDKSFKDASAAEELFAVHFAPNDAGNGPMGYGLYENVKAKSVTKWNKGHPGFLSYRNFVANKGGTVGFGDFTPQEAQKYFTEFDGGYQDGGHSIQNVIETGTKVADDGFEFFTDADPELAGLDFGTSDPAIYSKAKTFGFKFDVSKLPEGDALITLLHECINDGMAMAAKFEAPGGIGNVDVPEPTSIVSLGLIGLALAGSKLRKQNF